MNREHWAFDEAMELFRNLPNVSLFKLAFKLPEEWINNRLESYSSNFFGKLRRKFLYVTCSFFSISFFLYYLLVKLKS
ncbi:hypothetical protein LEP1GSC188_4617 [Leptospira weilii serovar Topaz str. LT2116]|uniref:Uncharacterized protein n=1 Tax=Leptospira weilii serovar Topaz str. LT2116 TaxID=1088540 RepID=M3H3A7_9LEPT|nr:hypothetical protein LEP1GSC188_4617 [Leptospira weilii serovar Topaz str. LT2116]